MPDLTRRTALKSMLAAAASLVLPAPRRRIDLRRWCGREGMGLRQYDMTLPCAVGDHTYATDGYACVRVARETGDLIHRPSPFPPAAGLSWDHDALRGWRELPRLEALTCDYAYCPTCDGCGYLDAGGNPAVAQECEPCGGTGTRWVGSNWDISHPVECKACRGQGHVPPAGAHACPNCRGKAVGRFPSVVDLDGRYFDVRLYEKARALGSEFVLGDRNGIPQSPLLKFRFDGGLGLLMGMNAAGVERRLVRAES